MVNFCRIYGSCVNREGSFALSEITPEITQAFKLSHKDFKTHDSFTPN